MEAMTTICVGPEVKKLLNRLKIHYQESYNSVVKRLAINAYDCEPLSDDEIKGIEESLKNIKEGKLYTHDEVWEHLKNEGKCAE